MQLYPYQERVKRLIQAGKSVILQAPTGSGKTRAALSPFIENFFDCSDGSTPRKCIYCVPMRVLANQFVLEFKDLSESYKRKFKHEMRVTIQTGEQPDDKEFSGDLIFCTIDQFLSSVLTMPYGLSNRKANLNAGVAIGSYLVFDEFHLLDPDSTLPTAWYVIQQASQIAPVLLMTATFSSSMLSMLAKDLNAEVVTVSREEARQIENRQPAPIPRQRTWFTALETLSAEAILKEHHQRSLVLCNTVRRAQALFTQLKHQILDQHLEIRLLMLHSRYLPEDRAQHEADLCHLFGKDKDRDPSGSVIAIATQTIEVGVNITSEVLHTELSPASSLIQRAGRCARYPGEQGKVIVYPVKNYVPYAMDHDGKAWQDEMLAAYSWLCDHSGQTFDFAKEQEFVDAVATPRDQRVIDGLMAGRASRKQDILRVLNGNSQSSDGRLLIRDANSCRILIHPQPDNLLDRPYSASGFSIQPTTLFGLVKSWEERADDLNLDWAAKVLVDPLGDEKESNTSVYRWERLDQSLIPGARVIAVNPVLCGYDRNEGFLPDRGDTDFLSTLPDDPYQTSWESYSYCLESYQEHVARVLKAFENVVLPELLYPAQALERAAGWREGLVIEAARFVCLFHDVGKLSRGWLTWARAHQQAVGNAVPGTFAIAHTDTQNLDDSVKATAREALRRNPKPNHAGEGAAAVSAIIIEVLQQPAVARAAITAITRHHTPFASDFQKFTLEPLAAKYITETLDLIPFTLKSKINLTPLQNSLVPDRSFASGILVQPTQIWDWLTYTLLVRALRRADSIGTSYGNK